DAHVDHDLLDARHLHGRAVAELLHELLDHRLAIVNLQAWLRRRACGSPFLLLLLLRSLLRLGPAARLPRAALHGARALRRLTALRGPGLRILLVLRLRCAHASITSPLDLK